MAPASVGKSSCRCRFPSGGLVGYTPKDTFIIAANISTMITLDPAAINESITASTMRSVCDALIELDDDDATKLVPGITESWTLSPDAARYDRKLADTAATLEFDKEAVQ